MTLRDPNIYVSDDDVSAANSVMHASADGDHGLEGTGSSIVTTEGSAEASAPLPPRPPHPSHIHHHRRHKSDDSFASVSPPLSDRTVGEALAALLFEKNEIEEEVYVCQPLGFEDPDYPNRVYKVEKALYRLHQTRGLKFGFTEVKTTSTPNELKCLLKDEDGEEVDVQMYRSMIGSLMYLTSSRPDIMFVVCACARYQVNPKVSHLHVVKRIFRYLKGQPKLGLWYPKDSPFDLVAYTDSDYARASLERKYTNRRLSIFLDLD
ncbi:hypothetical protein Tco_0494909 [Tanacetum coccineum]